MNGDSSSTAQSIAESVSFSTMAIYIVWSQLAIQFVFMKNMET